MTGFNTFAADSRQDLTMVLPPGSLRGILGASIRVWVVLASRGRILINTIAGLSLRADLAQVRAGAGGIGEPRPAPEIHFTPHPN